MESSSQHILEDRRAHRRRLMLWLSFAFAGAAFLVIATYLLSEPSLRSGAVGSAGLILDIVGACLVALPLFRPYKDPVAEGKQFLSQHEPWRTHSIVQHQERLMLPMQVGAGLLVVGFVVQLVAPWLP